ncbi:MAG: 50S ribosomal protein L11 methyltransferase [Flavobacteriales bacterium]|nr:50S ribosomal protein L11 methyltransferase [Flavobacteriales bacterium]
MKEFHTWDIALDPVLPAREVAVAYLNECGFSMFEPHDHGVLAHGEVGEVQIDEAEACLETIRAFATVTCEKRIVAQENWNAQWESEYPQVVVEDDEGRASCTIRAPFHEVPESGLDVVVAPQMSFGTGHHATTYLMTRALLALEVEGKPVLDMGCGTGVLALVAALRGANPVLGIDIEADAVTNSIDNVALNPALGHGEPKLTFRQGDGSALEEVPDEAWEVICANIHKNVLASDMSRYARTLSKGGSLLLSGFFEGDVRDLQEEVERHGLRVLAVALREGWACMHCGKPSA